MEDRECLWNTQSERRRKCTAVNCAGTEFSGTGRRGSNTENTKQFVLGTLQS